MFGYGVFLQKLFMLEPLYEGVYTIKCLGNVFWGSRQEINPARQTGAYTTSLSRCIKGILEDFSVTTEAESPHR